VDVGGNGIGNVDDTLGTLVWVVAGYSIAFGEGDFFGSGKILLAGITDKSLVGTIPELLFVAFQGTFAAMMLGQRKGHGKVIMKPFSPVLAVLGAVLLWFGWFGFNAGSQVAADGVAGNAFLITNVAAAVGVIGWLIAEYIVFKTPTLIGGASGAVAGLVAITPASGSAGLTGAIVIGFVGGIIGFLGVFKFKKMFKVDDSLDAFWIHGLVGIWGSLATALFIAPYLIDSDYSMFAQLLAQIKAIALTIVYSAIATAIVFFIAAAITTTGFVSNFKANGFKGIGRVDEETEQSGLDKVTHGETAMNL
jgi:Amt family ammonium transporter